MKKTSILLLLILCILLLATSVTASGLGITISQSVDSITLSKGFNWKNIKDITDYTKTNDGFIVVGGSTVHAWNENNTTYANLRTQGDLDGTAYIAKYTDSGSVAFIKTFGGNANDYYTSVLPAKDGGFIVAGDIRSNNAGNISQFGYDGNKECGGVLVKYDKNGNIKWAKTRLIQNKII